MKTMWELQAEVDPRIEVLAPVRWYATAAEILAAEERGDVRVARRKQLLSTTLIVGTGQVEHTYEVEYAYMDKRLLG